MSKTDEEASWSGLLNWKGVFQETLFVPRRRGLAALFSSCIDSLPKSIHDYIPRETRFDSLSPRSAHRPSLCRISKPPLDSLDDACHRIRHETRLTRIDRFRCTT